MFEEVVVDVILLTAVVGVAMIVLLEAQDGIVLSLSVTGLQPGRVVRLP